MKAPREKRKTIESIALKKQQQPLQKKFNLSPYTYATGKKKTAVEKKYNKKMYNMKRKKVVVCKKTHIYMYIYILTRTRVYVYENSLSETINLTINISP